jgi:hypothetical protein
VADDFPDRVEEHKAPPFGTCGVKFLGEADPLVGGEQVVKDHVEAQVGGIDAESWLGEAAAARWYWAAPTAQEAGADGFLRYRIPISFDWCRVISVGRHDGETTGQSSEGPVTAGA